MRILYLEDNPLLAFHVEEVIEDFDYVSAGSLSNFAEPKGKFQSMQFDAALVDIDLVDAPTGPEAAARLPKRGIPAILLTGQAEVAPRHHDISLGFYR
jgi:CheY-like chemotaxis protein